jgi:hypothetical protein
MGNRASRTEEREVGMSLARGVPGEWRQCVLSN